MRFCASLWSDKGDVPYKHQASSWFCCCLTSILWEHSEVVYVGELGLTGALVNISSRRRYLEREERL